MAKNVDDENFKFTGTRFICSDKRIYQFVCEPYEYKPGKWRAKVVQEGKPYKELKLPMYTKDIWSNLPLEPDVPFNPVVPEKIVGGDK